MPEWDEVPGCLPNGMRIRDLRRQLGWTQAQLAKRAGYDERTLNRIENGSRARLQTIKDVSQALGVPFQSLVLDDNPACIPIPDDFVSALSPRVGPEFSVISATHRGLSEPTATPRSQFSVGSPICAVVDLTYPCHLLLLDRDPDGAVSCLCPSRMAPESVLDKGVTYVPSERYFEVSFPLGREYLFAVIMTRPIVLKWMKLDKTIPFRELGQDDLRLLTRELKSLGDRQWCSFVAWFDVVL